LYGKNGGDKELMRGGGGRKWFSTGKRSVRKEVMCHVNYLTCEGMAGVAPRSI